MSERYVPTAAGIAEAKAMRAACAFYTYFPDTGPLRRELYAKHLAFFAASATYKQKLMLAANRIGKSNAAAYEITAHLTGCYPPWWIGRRFDRPVSIWCAGDTSGTARDIIQVALLGPIVTVDQKRWSGMIPPPLVYDVSRKQGIPSAISTIWVRHLSGGISSLDVKCHPAGSRVLMADGSWSAMETIRVGAFIRSPDGTARQVTQTSAYAQADVWRVETRGGAIEATGNHPMHTTTRGWVEASDLVVGETLTRTSGRRVDSGEILTITESGKQDVFCVGVDDVHELIVEGFRVGNSYDQKREAFQGTTQDVCWLDEEPPADIYSECLIRTMTNNGLMLVTMTPLMGLTPFLSEWLERSALAVIEDGVSVLRPAHVHVFGQSEREPGETPVATPQLSRYTVMATWDDCPHLSASAKDEMLREFPAYQRDARSRGIPALGSGTIYPIPESEIRCAPFEIPAHWPRAFALDTGWDWTAAIWIAVDRESQTVYAYSVYKRGHAEVPIHAEAIRSRGAWIPGVGDAAAITNQDGRQFVDIYRQHGLDLQLADKSVEAGIQDVWTRLSAGKLKVFSSCGPLFDEYRLYRRDDKGRIVKQNDHLCDCLRMAIRSGVARARVQRPDGGDVATVLDAKTADTNWMQG
jgi:phage terminase large subunit-like protein